MATETTEAQFPIGFDINVEEIDEGTASLEKLRATIKSSTDYLRQHNAAMKAIKGSSEQAVSARKELSGQLEKARAAIGKYNIALLEQGVTYEQLAEKEREALRLKEREAEALKKVSREALSAAGGPLKGLTSQYESLKSILGGGGGTILLLGLTVAAIAAVTAATVAGGVALGHWVAQAANASRAMAIMREAAGGSVANAQALGTQIDAIWRKVPTSAAALNELGSSITQAFVGSRVSGQGLVDTFAAVAQASSAMGDQVGSQLRGIIERGKQFGRVGLGLNELQGTGLNFDDVAAQLAKSMKTGVAQARQALVYGMVPVDAAAKAIRDAVEKRFGQINAKKLLDLDAITQKFHDRITKLASGFNLEPVLESLSKLSELFDTSTVTGAALQQMVTLFGQALGATFKGGTPIAKAFFEQFIIGTQRAIIWTLRFALFIKEHWGAAKAVLLGFAGVLAAKLVVALALATPAIWSFAAGVIAATWPILAIGAAIALVSLGIYELVKHWDDVKTFFANLATGAWQAATDFVDGLVGGLVANVSRVVDAAKNLGKSAWEALRNVWDSHSPSRLAFKLGADIGEGKALGIESKGGRVDDAAASSGQSGAGAMAGGGGGGRGAGGPTVHIGNVTIMVPAGTTNGEAVGRQAAKSFYAQLLELVEQMGESEGLPAGAGSP